MKNSRFLVKYLLITVLLFLVKNSYSQLSYGKLNTPEYEFTCGDSLTVIFTIPDSLIQKKVHMAGYSSLSWDIDNQSELRFDYRRTDLTYSSKLFKDSVIFFDGLIGYIDLTGRYAFCSFRRGTDEISVNFFAKNSLELIKYYSLYKKMIVSAKFKYLKDTENEFIIIDTPKE